MTLDQWLYLWLLGLMIEKPWIRGKEQENLSIFGVIIQLIGAVIVLIALVGASLTYWGLP